MFKFKNTIHEPLSHFKVLVLRWPIGHPWLTWNEKVGRDTVSRMIMSQLNQVLFRCWWFPLRGSAVSHASHDCCQAPSSNCRSMVHTNRKSSCRQAGVSKLELSDLDLTVDQGYAQVVGCRALWMYSLATGTWWSIWWAKIRMLKLLVESWQLNDFFGYLYPFQLS
jgi:hypothetical protein